MAVEPDDARMWFAVAANDALVSAAAAADPAKASDLSRLRKLAGPAEVRIALQLVAARAKAVRKFGNDAFGPAGERLVADVEGVEQASSFAASWPKAQRFAEAASALPEESSTVLDLGCGIGGDTWLLSRAGCAVVAFDRDPVRAAMAAQHMGCRAVVADVATLNATQLEGRLIHLDPARRMREAGHSRSRRTFALNDLRPSPDAVRRMIEASGGAAVKLSPGLDREALPEAFGEGELCFTSEPDGGGRRRKLSQATWYTGVLRRSASRSAAIVFENKRETAFEWSSRFSVVEFTGEPVPSVSLDVAKLRAFLVVPDPALERSELLHKLELPTLHPGLGLLTCGASPDPSALNAQAASWFEVVVDMPWRERDVKRWLTDHDAGVVEVKTRGRAVEPDALQRRLRGSGRALFTLFVLRLGRQVRAVVTRPVVG